MKIKLINVTLLSVLFFANLNCQEVEVSQVDQDAPISYQDDREQMGVSATADGDLKGNYEDVFGEPDLTEPNVLQKAYNKARILTIRALLYVLMTSVEVWDSCVELCSGTEEEAEENQENSEETDTQAEGAI